MTLIVRFYLRIRTGRYNELVGPLENLGYEEEHKAINNLISFLPEKLSKIKKESQIDTCIDHLSRLSNMRPEYEPLLEGLISAIKKVLQAGDINKTILKQKLTEIINSI